jgi:glucosamine--fructose-6-phosphate aminotransferase (isomerizing)
VDGVERMIAQVASLPDLVRTEFDPLDERARRVLDDAECRSVDRVLLVGCGDSHIAGVAARHAFEELAGVPAEPMTAMQAARHTAGHRAGWSGGNPLTIGISASGMVARTCEAVASARRAGALTVAVTGGRMAPLATAAGRLLDCAVPAFPHGPGVRSFRASLMALYLLAIHMGEANGRLRQDQAAARRAQLRGAAGAIAATLDLVAIPAREAAADVAGHTSFVFTGDGPSHGTAQFSAAKIIEMTGRHAMGQDTEEWAHLQYFVNVDPATPTFVVSPGGAGHHRAAELAGVMRRIGRTVFAVVPAGDALLAEHAHRVLPVAGTLPEVFSTMVFAVPGELLSAHLCAELGETPFRGSAGPYTPGGNLIASAS